MLNASTLAPVTQLAWNCHSATASGAASCNFGMHPGANDIQVLEALPVAFQQPVAGLKGASQLNHGEKCTNARLRQFWSSFPAPGDYIVQVGSSWTCRYSRTWHSDGLTKSYAGINASICSMRKMRAQKMILMIPLQLQLVRETPGWMGLKVAGLLEPLHLTLREEETVMQLKVHLGNYIRAPEVPRYRPPARDGQPMQSLLSSNLDFSFCHPNPHNHQHPQHETLKVTDNEQIITGCM